MKTMPRFYNQVKHHCNPGPAAQKTESKERRPAETMQNLGRAGNELQTTTKTRFMDIYKISFKKPEIHCKISTLSF